MILLANQIHYHRYPFFLLVAICVLLNLAKYLSVRLHEELIQNQLWDLTLKREFIVCIKIKLALALFVFSVMCNS